MHYLCGATNRLIENKRNAQTYDDMSQKQKIKIRVYFTIIILIRFVSNTYTRYLIIFNPVCSKKKDLWASI